jgi:hypothetical protein
MGMKFDLARGFLSYPNQNYKDLILFAREGALEVTQRRFGPRKDLVDIVKRCLSGPALLADLLKHAPPEFASAIFLLAKKGLVGFSRRTD